MAQMDNLTPILHFMSNIIKMVTASNTDVERSTGFDELFSSQMNAQKNNVSFERCTRLLRQRAIAQLMIFITSVIAVFH